MLRQSEIFLRSSRYYREQIFYRHSANQDLLQFPIKLMKLTEKWFPESATKPFV